MAIFWGGSLVYQALQSNYLQIVSGAVTLAAAIAAGLAWLYSETGEVGCPSGGTSENEDLCIQ